MKQIHAAPWKQQRRRLVPQKPEKAMRCPVYGLAFTLALAPASAAEPITGQASMIDGDTLLHEHREIAAIAITYGMFLSRVFALAVEQLTRRGASVRVLTRDPAKASFPEGVKVTKGDLLDIKALRNAFAGVSTLFLLNAVTGEEFT